MSLLSSRRRPWPYHMRVGSILGNPMDRVGLMLLPSSNGLLVGRKQQMLDGVVPSQQEYGSAPVYRERTWTFRPTGGYGERVQSSWGDHRYYWGLDVWVVGGLVGKGPLLHPVVPTTIPGPVVRFIDGMTNAGGLVQFVLAGQIIARRDSDAEVGGYAFERDFGSAVTDVARFTGGFAGATDSLYVALTNGQLWERSIVAAYTQCALPAGFLAQRVEVVGTQLWAADCTNSVVRNVAADPKVAANWSGPILVGTPSSKITAIRQTASTLVIFKDDGGIFTLNADGTVNDLFPGDKVPTNPENGRRAQAWMNALWFNAGPTFYRLTMPGAELTPTGPGKMLDNASPVRGQSRVLAGWGGYQAFLALWNPEDNTSYLLTYGNWDPKVTEQGTSWEFDDQYDGAIAHWPGKRVTAMSVSGAAGVDRLYIGFEDGTWAWFKLVKNPLAPNSGAEFTLGPSEIIVPLHHAGFQADWKHWLGFSVFGPVVRPGDEATLTYRVMASAGGPPTDPTGNWLPLGEFIANGQRIEAPSNLVGNALSLKISLANTNTATTPVIETVAFHERVVPAFKRDVAGTVDGRAVISRLDGAAYRPDPERVHRFMLNAAAAPGSVAIELPDETLSEVAIFDYSERLLPMQAGGGRAWAIDFQATQFRLLTVYGIIRRLRGTRIRDLRGYSIASLRYL